MTGLTTFSDLQYIRLLMLHVFLNGKYTNGEARSPHGAPDSGTSGSCSGPVARDIVLCSWALYSHEPSLHPGV